MLVEDDEDNFIEQKTKVINMNCTRIYDDFKTSHENYYTSLLSRSIIYLRSNKS